MAKKPINIRLDENLLDRLKMWQDKQPVKADRTAVIEAALDAWLKKQGE